MFRTEGKNKEKLQNAILYFAKYSKPKTVGKTKLAKLLYYLDFDHFEKHLEPVTRAVYKNKERGPMPDDFYSQLNEMRHKGKIGIKKIKTNYEKDMELIIPLVEPNLSVFTEDEIKTLKTVIGKWKDATGKHMTNESHKESPWKGTRRNEVVPYQLAIHR